MSKLNLAEVVEKIVQLDNRYDYRIYEFVHEVLQHTLKSLKRGSHGANRHVTPTELLIGLRDYALKEFGPMSKFVLNDWGVKCCEDFGHVVFNLVNSEVFGKTDTDSPEDFKNGYTFDDAFVKPYLPKKDKMTSKTLRRSTAPKTRRIAESGKAHQAGEEI
ncbi:MAG: Minf_1886 family protein [Candidatus Methylacidiphilales bacterium]|nr:Minf_1886 family protein [Candidatus Methylacidiphilales bacterium]